MVDAAPTSEEGGCHGNYMSRLSGRCVGGCRMSAWNFMSYESKDNLLEAVRRESAGMFALASEPDSRYPSASALGGVLAPFVDDALPNPIINDKFSARPPRAEVIR